ncbi:hypothetical protein [Prevotella sp.]|uniref:hypothetical protein n=1 Tax=Prevotella sp. TaxID=59823 RepID=UPI001CB41563|nr:hypothetical protein [Prevotella sp.]MBF1628976.1 hypothetical protein [Prevotella sp.]
MKTGSVWRSSEERLFRNHNTTRLVRSQGLHHNMTRANTQSFMRQKGNSCNTLHSLLT